MRIAVWHNLPSGGGKRALNDHLRGLTSRGHSVEIWAPPHPEPGFLPFEAYGPCHTVPLALGHPASTRWAHWRQAFAEADRLAKAHADHATRVAEEIGNRFDLVFANTDLHFHAPFLGRFAKIPALLYLQETNRPLYQALPELPWLAPKANLGLKARLVDAATIRRTRRMGREEVENARAFKQILVNSAFSRECLLAAYGVESQVCYLGVDTDRFKCLDLPRERWVVGTGAFVPAKRIAFVIEALATLPASVRPPLRWIGNMADPEHLKELVQLAKQGGVQFEPRVGVTDAELVETLNQAALMVYAPRLEPFGYAPIEANACGTPVVAVAEGGVRETVVDQVNGRLAASDPGPFGAAVAELLDDDQRRRAMGEEGLRMARSLWSLEASIDRIEEHLLKTANL